ncbi:hypothetical protein J6590_007979 [Homalodisca vitripennis]|nr:hypothetical protein J6590_007979 [Homalodisca vitripennis]
MYEISGVLEIACGSDSWGRACSQPTKLTYHITALRYGKISLNDEVIYCPSSYSKNHVAYMITSKRFFYFATHSLIEGNIGVGQDAGVVIVLSNMKRISVFENMRPHIGVKLINRLLDDTRVKRVLVLNAFYSVQEFLDGRCELSASLA